MTEWEWFKLVIGVLLPLLIGHGIWATVTIIRLRHIVEGPDGNNGMRSDVRDLMDWRSGREEYGPHDLETRCRHTARNLDQEMVGKLEDKMQLERRKLPRRNHP